MTSKESYQTASKGSQDGLLLIQFGFRKSFQLNTRGMEANY